MIVTMTHTVMVWKPCGCWLMPRDCQRDPAAVIVEAGLGAGEGHPVIARDDHDRVVELASLGEQVQSALHIAVEAFNLDVVIEDVVARDRVIGQVRRDDDLRRILPRLLARAEFVGAVRVSASQPEAEGLVAGLLPEEFVKALERVAGGVARAAARLPPAGSPALAGVAHPKAGPVEHFCVGR